jgi:hypothetical protein
MRNVDLIYNFLHKCGWVIAVGCCCHVMHVAFNMCGYVQLHGAYNLLIISLVKLFGFLPAQLHELHS